MSANEKNMDLQNSENKVDLDLQIPSMEGNFNATEFRIDSSRKLVNTDPNSMKSSEYDSDEEMTSSENEPEMYTTSGDYPISENNSILKIPTPSNIGSLFPSLERNPYLKNLTLGIDPTFDNAIILNNDPNLENDQRLEEGPDNYLGLKIPTYYNKSEVKPFECGVCGKAFKKVGWLTDHMWTHSTDTPYKCEICHKPVNSSKALKNHMKLHSGDKPFKCDICGKDFRTAGNVQAHVWTHTKDTPFKCGICGKAVNSKGSLKRHSKIHTNDKQFKCDICDKAFLRSTQLQTHVRIHTGEKPYTCDICGHRFSHSSDMVRHKRVHSDDKPYKCDLCKKSYTTNSSLVTHKRSHSGEKPFVCKICHKTYNRANSLTKHFQRNHEPKSSVPGKKDVSGKTFSKSVVCGKTFSAGNQHSKSQPNKKDVCGKTFSVGNQHSKSQPNKKDVCGKTFSNESDVCGKTFGKIENVHHRKQSNPKSIDVSMNSEFSLNSSSDDDENPEKPMPSKQELLPTSDNRNKQMDYSASNFTKLNDAGRFTDLETKLPLAVVPSINPEVKNRLSGDMDLSSKILERKMSQVTKNNGNSNVFTSIKEAFDESDEVSSDDTENYDPEEYTVDSEEDTSDDDDDDDDINKT